MVRSFHQNIAHIIFSTKNRQPLITGDLESDLHSYLGGIIEGQKEHHRTATFKEEFLAFLERHEIEYDGRFVWE